MGFSPCCLTNEFTVAYVSGCRYNTLRAELAEISDKARKKYLDERLIIMDVNGC